jgi:hypothetical protein
MSRITGNCCCFCGQGSGIGVHTAAHPLGPWTYHDNIGCKAGFNTSNKCGCGMNHGGCPAIYGHSLTRAQQNFVMPVRTSGVRSCGGGPPLLPSRSLSHRILLLLSNQPSDLI